MIQVKENGQTLEVSSANHRELYQQWLAAMPAEQRRLREGRKKLIGEGFSLIPEETSSERKAELMKNWAEAVSDFCLEIRSDLRAKGVFVEPPAELKSYFEKRSGR